jgi:hypothetical protein
MPRGKKITIMPDDTEGHGYRWEDLTGQEVTVRLEDGTEVEGHLYRGKIDMTGEDTEGHGRKNEDMTGDDTEGHRRRHALDLEVDDTAANLLRAATDRGEPVHVRFPDEDDVQGHRASVKF